MVIIVLATRSPGGSDQAVLWRSRTAHTYEQGGAFDSAVREGEHQGAGSERQTAGPLDHQELGGFVGPLTDQN